MNIIGVLIDIFNEKYFILFYDSITITTYYLLIIIIFLRNVSDFCLLILLTFLFITL